MRKIKAFLSYILLIALLFSLLPTGFIKVKAASMSNFKIKSYTSNSTTTKYELKVEWEGNKLTENAEYQYYVEDTGDLSSPVSGTFVQEEPVDLSTSRFTYIFDVSNLKKDYLYELTFNTYDSNNSKSSITVFFIPGMTFVSERVDRQLYSTDFESGTSPELKLSWKIPKVYDGSSWVNISETSAIDHMKLFNSDIASLNFKINIATAYDDLNNGSDISPISIQGSGTNYIASDAYDTKPVTYDNLADNPLTESFTFNLIGRKDTTESPVDIYKTDERADSLYHSKILPGTVYFMNIKPIFADENGEGLNVFTLGDPSQNNGNLVKDLASGCIYTYTPIRFKITRDAIDNIYVTAYKVNSGTINLPNLYYSIQAIDDTSSSQYGDDWLPEKARITKQLFPEEADFATQVISGIDVDTTLYYKVVVKTDSKDDRIESLAMKYQMSKDTSKPPVPINVKVDMTKSELVTKQVTVNGSSENVRSTDIQITWERPSNYDSMDKTGLVYHVMICTNAENLDQQKSQLEYAGITGEYLVNYRWVKAISPNDVKEDGDKLTYTLKGFDLFKNTDGSPIINPDEYPEWLIDNKIYYLKMFTTKDLDYADISDKTNDNVIDDEDFKLFAVPDADDKVSQTSVATSFTTLPGTDKQVPVPTGFEATGENIDTSKTEKQNYITLQFDRANINWSAYTSVSPYKAVYELFMATSNEDDPEYFQIGSVDDDTGNSTFTPQVSGYTAADMVRQNNVYVVTVPDLKPNSVYRFKLRLRLDLTDTEDLESDFTAVVSVTTRKVQILDPDATTQVPVAPSDFNISTTDGVKDISSTGVGLKWSILEEDVAYELVVTETRPDANASDTDFENDAYYKSFITKFGSSTKNLNPSSGVEVDNFTPDLTAKNCKYNVVGFMFPNMTYYYSLRAVRSTTSSTAPYLYSQWVTIPVTSSMVEMPTDLTNIQDYELGVSWEDSTTGITAANYTMYIKKSKETSYSAVNSTKVSVVKNGTTYYARITGLESGTSYDIGAFKGTDTSNLDFGNRKWTLSTRDEYHNVEVKWKGIENYSFNIAIKSDTTGEYVVLTKDTEYTLQTEKSTDQVGNGYCYYYARILKMPVTLSTGDKESLQLTSNSTYQVKVRAVYDDVQTSNYTAPVTARTSFLQSDYDDNEDVTDTTAKLVDKVNEIEQKPYYMLNYVLTTTNTLLLKGDKLSEELEASQYHELSLDLTDISSAGRQDEIYIPYNLTRALKSTGGSIRFILDESEYTLVSTMLDDSTYDEVTELKDENNIEDDDDEEVWFKISFSRLEGGTEGLDSTVTALSTVNMVDLDVMVVTTSYSDLRKDFTDKVYNSETGLLKEKKDEVKDMFTKDTISLSSQSDYLIETLVKEVEEELADYVQAKVEGGTYSKTTYNSIILDSTEIQEFAAPIIARLSISQTDDYCQPYGIYKSGTSWNKLDFLQKEPDQISFELVMAGKYVIAKMGGFSDSISKSHWAYAAIVDFNNKYNIADVFTAAGDFNPDAPVSIKDSILILDKVFSRNSVNGETLQKKVSRLSLSPYFTSISPLRDLSREQAATIYVTAYSINNGLTNDSLKPTGVVVFNDAGKISSVYFKNAQIATDLGFISCDANGMFNPAGYITRAEFITSLQKALEK